MARKSKDSKLLQAAHIKRHTEGTSNEISFSVLDAAKKAADGDAGAGGNGKVPLFGRISLFTLPRKKSVPTPQKDPTLPYTNQQPPREGSQPPTIGQSALAASMSSSPTSSRFEMPSQEVAQRKARRIKKNRLLAFIAIAAVLAAVGAGGIWAYGELTKYQDEISMVELSLRTIDEADAAIKALDEMLIADVGAATEAEYEALIDDLAAAGTKLDEADALARQAAETMRDSAGKEAARQAIAGIEARREMMAIGSVLAEEGITAHRASASAESGWAALLEGDKAARDASALIGDPTPENIQASKDKSIDAQAHFAQAVSHYRDAVYLYPTADFDTQIDYLLKRMEGMGYAIASDDALLAFNKEEAIAQNDAYTIADAEAVALAKSFPADPLEPLDDAYDANTQKQWSSYTEARSKASSVDAFLRDYLGTEDK